MKNAHIKSIYLALTLLFAGVGLAGTAQAGDKHESKDIVAVASDMGNFKTLVAAIKAAGLVKTLLGTGPFTVFTPTDKAFAKLPAGTVDDLLKPENKKKLAALLTYHVGRDAEKTNSAGRGAIVPSVGQDIFHVFRSRFKLQP